jgi:hypothetical protein
MNLRAETTQGAVEAVELSDEPRAARPESKLNEERI